MATKHEIEIIIAKLSAAFPNWKVTAYTVQVYLEDLQDIDSDTLEAAVKMCRTEAGRAFAPSTGEIRGAVGKLRGLASNTPSPYEAWREFKQYVVASNHSPEWSHPLVEKTARLIGMRDYGQSNVDDEPSWRARFIQCYEQLLDRAQNENLLLPEVRGYIESNGGRFLAPLDQMKQLADRMKK